MSVNISLVKVEKLVINNPKAVAILSGAILTVIGALLPNLWVAFIGAVILFLSVLASLPKDVRKWLMKGLGKAAKDVWES